MAVINSINVLFTADTKQLANATKNAEKLFGNLGLAMKRGSEITKENRNDTEKYRAGLLELKTLLGVGAISQQTFNRAVKELPQPVYLQNLISGLKFVGAGVATATAALVAMGIKGAASIASIGREAKALGAGTNELAKLQYIASQTGTDAETLTSALGTMQGNLLAVSANAGGPAAAALAALGLNARELASQDPSVAFKRIAGAISTLPGQLDRLNAAEAIFGGQGRAMIGTLSAGAEKLDTLGARFNKLGGNISDLDVSNVNALYAAFSEVGTVLGGIGMRIASEVSPYVTALTTSFTTWATESFNASNIVSGALGGVQTALSYVGDFIQTGVIAWKTFRTAASIGVFSIVKSLGYLAKGIDYVVTSLGYQKTGAADFLEGMASELGESIKDQIGDITKDLIKPSWGEQVTTTLQGIGTAAETAAKGMEKLNGSQRGGTAFSETTKKVLDLVKGLNEQSATFNMSSHAAELYKLKLAGASEAEQNLYKAAAKRLNTLEVLKAVATPVEKFKMEVGQILQDVNAGLLEKGAAFRAIASKGMEFFGDTLFKHAGAMEFGSKEARSTILEYAGRASLDPNREAARASQNIFKTLADVHTPLLERIANGSRSAAVVSI